MPSSGDNDSSSFETGYLRLRVAELETRLRQLGVPTNTPDTNAVAVGAWLDRLGRFGDTDLAVVEMMHRAGEEYADSSAYAFPERVLDDPELARELSELLPEGWTPTATPRELLAKLHGRRVTQDGGCEGLSFDATRAAVHCIDRFARERGGAALLCLVDVFDMALDMSALASICGRVTLGFKITFMVD